MVKSGNAENHDANARWSFGRQNSTTTFVAGRGYGYASLEAHEPQSVLGTQTRNATKLTALEITGTPIQIKRVPVGSKTQTHIRRETSPSHVGIVEPTTSAKNQNVALQTDLPAEQPANAQTSARSSQYSCLGQQNLEDLSPEGRLLARQETLDEHCPTQGDILTSPWSWFAISILALAIYSTIFSGIFLGIAFAKPRWGERVGTRGNISFSNATLVSALVSKTIELSFVTVFVALLGQILSRRAFAKKTGTGGISIAEMTMRSWVMQPGTLITNWISVRHTATTTLGGLVLIAVVAATLYTTAAEALVSPKLKFGPLEDRTLKGQVAAQYANSIYMAQSCQTPVQESNDKDKGTTCLQIEHSGQSFRNLKAFMASWDDRTASGNMSSDKSSLEDRPPPTAMLFDNTTVLGQWISLSDENITTDSRVHKRLVQNITLAMPHANIVNAAKDRSNHILQPDDLQGNGEYIIQAALPAPSINVLCVGMSATELKPLISTDSIGYAEPTAVDDIFGFSEDFGENRQFAPSFPKLPIEYNTIAYISNRWGAQNLSVYVLVTPPAASATGSEHVLCSIKSMQYQNCTTLYHVARSGGQISVQCNDRPGNVLPYRKLVPDAPLGVWEPNWKDVGSEWVRSIDLNAGVSDANASNARLMSEMVPTYQEGKETYLPTTMPSLGESLAVLAGGTALLSSFRAPFVHSWDYPLPILEDPQYQTFQAKVRFTDFASGGAQDWQGIFYVILVAVFLLSVFSLVYLLWAFCLHGKVTDFTEPQNLFALAINSPSSRLLSGSCGAGPHGEILTKKWQVGMQSQSSSLTNFRHPHFYVRYREDDLPGISDQIKKKRRSRPPTIGSSISLSAATSPVVEQYIRLSGK